MDIIRFAASDRSTPTIHRTPEELAAKHGYASPADLAEALPEGETVIDVGASLSQLGHVVTKLRGDITWVNFDLAYTGTSNTEFRENLRR